MDKKFFRLDAEREARDRESLGKPAVVAPPTVPQVQTVEQVMAELNPPMATWKKVALGIGGLFIAWIVFELNCSTGATQNGDCEKRIKAILKDPDTATFNNFERYTWKSNGKVARVQVDVRAQNSFGGFFTKNMTCYYDESGTFSHLSD